ncbi:hypothetical protein AAC387_Pa10g1877 [Persea americana]
MVPELEKPRVTEIQVRIDCNGCVQKIKKALYGIKGIYDIYINTQQQKLTVVGWADPEKIIKAIKKTRKLATICAHSEASEPQPPNPPPPAEGTPPAPDPGNPPPTETPPADPAPPAEGPKEQPQPQPQPENPPQEVTPPPPAPTDNAAETPPSGGGPPETKDVEQIHVIHHHPHQYGYNDHWNSYTNGYGFRPEGPQYGFRPEGPQYGFRPEGPHCITTHSYNNYRPSPHISAYVTEYGYPRSPPQNVRYEYSRPEHYSDDYDYQIRSGNGNGNNITSFFSDENPNACRIV